MSFILSNKLFVFQIVAGHAESQESSYVLIKNEETPEMDITSENAFTMEHEHENNLPESRLNG